MKKFFVLFICLLTIQASCFAIPNPKYLRENAINSKIKAVATVTNIKTEKKTDAFLYRIVTFKDGNKTYTGKCIERRNTRAGKMIVGPLCFKPKKRELVYVTIKENNGEITTYQPLTKEEAEKFKSMPDKIDYSIGKAYIKD